MNAAVLGATRGIGRALARRMAERGDAVCVMGRDPEQLERSARDLAIRGTGQPVATAVCDLDRPETFAPALDGAAQALRGLDCVAITAALFAPQDELEADPERRDALLRVNFVRTIALCEEARARLLAGGGGTLCVFSSVAGERARKPVILYGATKAGLSYYLEGLDHKFRRRGLATVTVKPGFVRTGMTDGIDPPPFASEPDAVARVALRAIDRRRPVAYAPPIWASLMFGVRNLPRAVMRRVGF